jgi:hypothetical protein
MPNWVLNHPLKVEVRSQDFEAQVHAVIDAGAPVLSFIYGVPPLEIECAMVGDLSVTEELREHVWANH